MSDAKSMVCVQFIGTNHKIACMQFIDGILSDAQMISSLKYIHGILEVTNLHIL